MRWLQRNKLARGFVALVLAAALGALLTPVVPLPVASVVFVVLTVVGFVALSSAPDAIALQRRQYWRWWWRSSGDEGPFWPGTRVPRRPRRPE